MGLGIGALGRCLNTICRVEGWTGCSSDFQSETVGRNCIPGKRAVQWLVSFVMGALLRCLNTIRKIKGWTG